MLTSGDYTRCGVVGTIRLRRHWQGVEDYLYKHTALRFTHGLCPDCLRELYAGMSEEAKRPAPRSAGHE